MLTKKFITMMILFVALAIAGSSSFAQNLPGDKAGRVADMLFKKLNLTQEQYSKVYSSLLGYYTNQANYTKDFKGNKSAYNDACMKDWEKVKTSMSSVLNKDQLAEFSSISENKMMYNTMVRRHKTETKTPEAGTTGMTTDPSKKTTETKTSDATKKTNDTKTTNATNKTNQTNSDTKKNTGKK
jgi:hypothetical protein